MSPHVRSATLSAKIRGHFGTGPIVGARFCNDGRAVLERRTCGQSHSAGHGTRTQSTRGATSNHLYPRDVLKVQWQIQQVMVRVRCAPTDAVNPQGRLIERSPSNAEVRLDAKGSSGTNVHPRDGLQHVCDGRGRGLSHFLLANDHKGARRFLGQRFRQTPRHGSRLNGCGVDRHGRLSSSNKGHCPSHQQRGRDSNRLGVHEFQFILQAFQPSVRHKPKDTLCPLPVAVAVHLNT